MKKNKYLKIIDQIEKVRKKNNVNWMDILRVAYLSNPKKPAGIIAKIYKEDKSCFKKLKKKFPSYIKSFPIKKTELVKIISYDRDNLKKISSVVHPIVRKKMSIFLRENRHRKMVILDIPLLIENKINNSFS